MPNLGELSGPNQSLVGVIFVKNVYFNAKMIKNGIIVKKTVA